MFAQHMALEAAACDQPHADSSGVRSQLPPRTSSLCVLCSSSPSILFRHNPPSLSACVRLVFSVASFLLTLLLLRTRIQLSTFLIAPANRVYKHSRTSSRGRLLPHLDLLVTPPHKHSSSHVLSSIRLAPRDSSFIARPLYQHVRRTAH